MYDTCPFTHYNIYESLWFTALLHLYKGAKNVYYIEFLRKKTTNYIAPIYFPKDHLRDHKTP